MKPEFQKGRGTSAYIPNRFEKLHYEPDNDREGEVYFDPDDFRTVKTEFFKDASRSIVAQNDSPDVGFNFSVNAYRGCEHGCAYCYARPGHEYLGLSAGLDFESKIFVKERAPELLREKLMSKSWKPECITMSGVTDCYQPAERQFELTRKCLEVFREFKNPCYIITKNSLVQRDIDILKDLAAVNCVGVTISVTTLDPELCGKMEPRTSRPAQRLKTIEVLAKAGVNVGVNAAPLIPAVTDHELPAILKAAADAGAKRASYILVRLPMAVAPVFTGWLERYFPDRKEKVLSHLKDMRGGRLNDPRFGNRMRGEGEYAENLSQMFKLYTKKLGLNQEPLKLSTEHFTRPDTSSQLKLF